ncbi:hypothetical protein HYPSUDRAFT_202614 [Hypholoma sublateritium FD-334 SS-4]|uniref:Proline dehydrogenase n=1 Tax=Hypholoma sublateritium (strain FD-334 SS-4) TaxID=945553 RepID=A0A0D2NSR2_HYPSF|nr:hypothetical protein HYPSUDRAFT_202614 [Hypholoma sublateritium FD-334 SS-4]
MLRQSLKSTISSALRRPYHPRFISDKVGTTSRANWTRRAVAGVTLVAASALTTTIYADSDVDPKTRPTLGSQVRAYFVYSMCSIPALVDASPKLLSMTSAVPGLKQITEAFVRVTFFDQFVGADTAEEAIPLLRSLRAAKKGVLFAYSVEVDQKEATGASTFSSSTDNTANSFSSPNHPPAENYFPYERILKEILHCIDIAADFEEGIAGKSVHESEPHGGRTWVAVKTTALVPDAHALIALSSRITESRKSLPKSSKHAVVPFPGSARIDDLDSILHPSNANNSDDRIPLTTADIHQIQRLYADLSKICAHAREKGVKIIVDAEYSWYQPAIDALTMALMREFNSRGTARGSEKVQPLIYSTHQCYLRRTPAQLALAIEDSRTYNYALGVKLVRGAYHPHELDAHSAASAARPSPSISPDAEPPVWREKRDTDYTYNECVRMLFGAIREDVHGSGAVDAAAAAKPADAAPRGWSSWVWGAGAQVAPAYASPTASSTPRIGVLFGTHNWDSCALILKELVRNGLAIDDPQVEGGIKVSGAAMDRVSIGQLYGMCDDLTEWVTSRISSSTPFVIKYVPYGALEETMPYLSRRAIENKSVLGGGAAKHERERAAQEIWKRIFG